jgi:alkylhydroperoxidase family enzyme
VKALKDETLVRAVLDDWKSAPVDERLRAMLAFLEKLTLRPDETEAADVAGLRRLGWADEAIEKAVYVCFCFSVMDRLADALGFQVNTARGLKWVARILLGPSYKIASIA